MADFTQSKSAVGGALLENAIETSWNDCGPLVTPEEVRELHLFGIPLYSFLRNPETGKPDKVTDTLIKRLIVEAVGLAETEADVEIFPRQHDERKAYDQQEQNSFGFMKLRHRPVQSVQSLAIQSSDGVNVWTIPLEWLDVGYLHTGQLNLIPFAVSAQAGVTIPITSPVGLGLLPSLFRFNWVPGLWQCRYTTGFKDSLIPRVVNQLIGVVAAMEILSMLATTRIVNSSSLGIDGLSTSVSMPGPQVYQTRLTDLAAKRKWLVSKIKRAMGGGMIVDNI